MGLDLELFEDRVPEDLVCALCHKVVVHPVQSACNHLFCRVCLRRVLKHKETQATCPTCRAELKDVLHQPSVEVKVKLLSLPVHCSHQCGKVCTLAELPDHVAEECPHAPVTCPHARRGCKMTVRRVEAREHAEECDYRFVHCEACGQRTLFVDLYSHQARKKCVEKKLRQQLIKAVKITSTEVKLHRRFLERQHLRLEQQQRQRRMDHHRQTTAAISAKGHRHPHTTTTTTTTGSGGHSGSSNGSEYDSPSVAGTEVTTSDPLHPAPGPRDVFLTSSKVVDGEEGGLHIPTPTPSRSGPGVARCRNCGKQFRENVNSPNACRWHPGPIIELFGGTCYSCGRLDYQKGCMMGYHELLH